MGNRNANGRRKTRSSAYAYSENGGENYSTQKSGGGSINRRGYNTPINSFHTHPQHVYHPTQHNTYPSHTNGYGITTNSQTNTVSSKPNPSKLIYVANYDFNGTAATGELSFHKGDRLEIIDRYS